MDDLKQGQINKALVAINVQSLRFPALCDEVRALLTQEPAQTTEKRFESVEEWLDRVQEAITVIRNGLDTKAYHDHLQRELGRATPVGTMSIKVKAGHQLARYTREARKDLRSRGQSGTLPEGEAHGEWITFNSLSEVQFVALEDIAVRLGLAYDGRQAEQPEPECPEGYYWNGRQCLKQDNLLRPSTAEREGF